VRCCHVAVPDHVTGCGLAAITRKRVFGTVFYGGTMRTTPVPLILLVFFLAITQMGGCGGGGSSGGVDLTPAGEVFVSGGNSDGTAYKLVLRTFDNSTGSLVVTDTVLCDPIAGSGACSIQVPVVISTSDIMHVFAILDTGSGGLIDSSPEYVKGADFQSVVVSIAGAVVTWI